MPFISHIYEYYTDIYVQSIYMEPSLTHLDELPSTPAQFGWKSIHTVTDWNNIQPEETKLILDPSYPVKDLTSIIIPNHITELIVSECELTALPFIDSASSNLTVLDCTQNNLSIIPFELPRKLNTFNCSFNQLTSLPELQHTSLTLLNCGHNKLEQLPALPRSLSFLYCNYNKLVSLPELKHTVIHEIECDHNKLTTLPEMPPSLTMLDCQSNQIETIPNLHRTKLVKFEFRNNPLTHLPLVPRKTIYRTHYDNTPAFQRHMRNYPNFLPPYIRNRYNDEVQQYILNNIKRDTRDRLSVKQLQRLKRLPPEIIELISKYISVIPLPKKTPNRITRRGGNKSRRRYTKKCK